VLQLQTPEGETIQKTLRELRKVPIGFDFGMGHVHVESTDFQPDPEYTPSQFDRLCGGIRAASMVLYNWVFWPILAIGIVVFIISALAYWKHAIWNVCFMMALVCWGLAYVRTTLLLLIDSSTFSALHPFYLAPAYFMLVSGAVLSIAAFVQLSPFRIRSPQSQMPSVVEIEELLVIDHGPEDQGAHRECGEHEQLKSHAAAKIQSAAQPRERHPQ
jgi:hypothetical protein